MNLELLKTADGSYTLYRTDIDETYHSQHGAIQESAYVFIQQGLKYFIEKHPYNDCISIFEVGFGTGLNAILSLEETGKSIHYFTLEKHPIEEKLHKNWLLKCGLNNVLSNTIVNAEWNKKVEINQHFLHKAHKCLFDFDDKKNSFDIVYFDAFGFRAQEEMWQQNVCNYLFQLLKNGGILVTYAAKGSFRRNLVNTGFTCEKLPGPPGKREMIRATKL